MLDVAVVDFRPRASPVMSRTPRPNEAAPTATTIEVLLAADSGNILLVNVRDRSDADHKREIDHVCCTLLAQTVPFAVIMDLRELTQFPSTQREMYAAVRGRLRAVYDKHHRLTVYVAKTSFQRGFVTAVGWKAAAHASSGREFTEDLEQARVLCWQALTANP
jgi:hypothetical protein